MLRTKIVCTIGPACRSPRVLRELIHAGMSVARLNMSHGDLVEHQENILRIREASDALARPVAILMDLQGPKLRLGMIKDGGVVLMDGHEVVLTTRGIVGSEDELPVQFEDLPLHVTVGERVLLNDGLLELEVTAVEQTEIYGRVITGGSLRSNQGLNLPQASLSIPAITEKDRRDLRFGLNLRVDWIGLSFVRSADEISALKGLIAQQDVSSSRTPVVAKIEKPEAVENIDAIVEASDAIMVARGDLGIETPPEEVPVAQKMIIKKCNRAGKPVITATQMLDSMMRNPRPTRAEASDVANAVFDGTDALMLSGETAVGRYPLKSTKTMAKIAGYAETHMPTFVRHDHPLGRLPVDIAEGVSYAAYETARHLGAAAIITPTLSGYTARMVSKYRPQASIVAVTPDAAIQRRLMLHWGVYPLRARRADSTDEIVAHAVSAAKDSGLVSDGDVVVVTGGAANSPPGTTNIMKVQVVEDILGEVSSG